MATSAYGWDSFFSTTLSSAITAADTTIPLAAAPTAQEGVLVIEPDSSTNREIIYYTSVSGNSVVCPSVGAGRGQEGTSALAHSSGVTVKRNTTSRDFEVLQDGSAFAAGIPVQVVSTTSSAVATGTTTIPLDDTIPQNTEGDQYMTLTITPKATTNKLVIHVKAFLSTSTAGHTIGALFQDTTANALAATDQYNDTNTGVRELNIVHIMDAGTTSSTTFKFRAGKDAAGTTTFNGSAGARLFGAIPKSAIVIMEYKA